MALSAFAHTAVALRLRNTDYGIRTTVPCTC